MRLVSKKLLGLLVLVQLFTSNIYAVQIADIEVKDTYKDCLVLKGAGIRSKWFFDLYVASLYLQSKSTSELSVINDNKKMNLKLHITSGMITSEKMTNATLEGFENSTNGNTSKIQNEINQFMSVFSDEIKQNDVFDFYYIPNDGLQIYKNNTLKDTIVSFEFKQALFGIWFGNEPAQDSLKDELLGKNID